MRITAWVFTITKGVQIREGGPNPLADWVPRGSKSASEFGPGGPNLGGSKSARTPSVLGFCNVSISCHLTVKACQISSNQRLTVRLNELETSTSLIYNNKMY